MTSHPDQKKKMDKCVIVVDGGFFKMGTSCTNHCFWKVAFPFWEKMMLSFDLFTQ